MDMSRGVEPMSGLWVTKVIFFFLQLRPCHYISQLRRGSPYHSKSNAQGIIYCTTLSMINWHGCISKYEALTKLCILTNHVTHTHLIALYWRTPEMECGVRNIFFIFQHYLFHHLNIFFLDVNLKCEVWKYICSILNNLGYFIRGENGAALADLLCFCFLSSAFLPHLLIPLSLWAWQQQQSGAPEEDQLVPTGFIYLAFPPLCAGLLCPIWWLYSVALQFFFWYWEYLMLQCFCCCSNACITVGSSSEVSRTFASCSPENLRLHSTLHACLPACNPGHPLHNTPQHRLLNESFAH